MAAPLSGRSFGQVCAPLGGAGWDPPRSIPVKKIVLCSNIGGGHFIFRLLAMLCRCLGWERGRKASSWGIRRAAAGQGRAAWCSGGERGIIWGCGMRHGDLPLKHGGVCGAGSLRHGPPQPGFLGPGDAFPSLCSPHPFPFRAEATVGTARAALRGTKISRGCFVCAGPFPWLGVASCHCPRPSAGCGACQGLWGPP